MAAAPEAGPEAGLDALDAALLELVQRAPQGTPGQLRAAAEHALRLALRVASGADAGPAAADAAIAAKLADELIGLGCAMERCLELIGDGLVDAGVALPALAMAAHAARSSYAPALTAARYEIETLLPIPGKVAAPRKTLDVPAASLIRRPERAAERAAEPAASPLPSSPLSFGQGAAAIAATRLAELYAPHSEAAIARVEQARQKLRA